MGENGRIDTAGWIMQLQRWYQYNSDDDDDERDVDVDDDDNNLNDEDEDIPMVGGAF